ncbi:MAG: hypothetical protein DMG62_04855 [Acidobacteria bacterium]|nr:MAG: hypothetical protein DMG63_14955 [Acidobacteriota bacterium]PYY24051.1 MAG: hypothetical protein DMG62_04855 [Acidobacteriota bacterium]
MKKAEATRFDAGHVPMSEELDSARWSLPPIVPVVIAAVVLAIIVGVYLLSSRNPPTSTGSAIRVVALPLHIESKGSIAPGQEGTLDQNVEKRDSVLVNIAIDVKNAIGKPMYIKNIEGKLVAEKGEFNDSAAPASDYERIVQAYPQLAIPDAKPLQSESRIDAQADQQGVVVFSFPLAREDWDKRKSLQATVNFYDHAPLVIDATQIAAAQETTLPTRVMK